MHLHRRNLFGIKMRDVFLARYFHTLESGFDKHVILFVQIKYLIKFERTNSLVNSMFFRCITSYKWRNVFQIDAIGVDVIFFEDFNSRIIVCALVFYFELFFYVEVLLISL